MGIDEVNDDEQSTPRRGQSQQTKSADNKTPMLDSFGKNLTQMAEEGKLDPIVGREEEIDRIIQILGRRKKNNPVLVGEPGVGKTAIVEGIAKKIVERKVSRVLYDKKIYQVELSSIVAGTKYRGQFEERMKSLIDEIEQNPDVIVFIDELHTMIGAGNTAGGMDVSNMLKPPLARGVIQCIGATTLDEYKKSIERDAALDRRFQKVTIDPPSKDETKQILENIKDFYEKHHNVKYSPEAIDSCVTFADRYITTRFFPDKAIDVMDETGSRVHLDNINVPQNVVELEDKLEKLKTEKNDAVKKQNYEEAARFRDTERMLKEELEANKKNWEKESEKNRTPVSEEDIARVVAKMTGIPVYKMTQDEGIRLLNMPEELMKRVIGQDHACEKVAEAIQRSRAGLQNPKRPIASFIFLGSTGVGKTELCKALADYLFNSEENLIKLDMSEYMEPHSVSKMIGSPPGYVGYDEGGQLTEAVKNKPYSVVLFDEIEKAHPDVSNILLQILDEGKLTDALGKTVDFKNTIIIMTSNIGTRELEIKEVGFGSGRSENDTAALIAKALKKVFRPEFINRIDEQVIFNKLEKEDVIKIVDIHLKDINKRVEDKGFKLNVTRKLKELIADEGFSEEFGARPILRAIIRYVQNPVSKEVLKGTFKQGETIKVDFDTKKDEVKVSKEK